MKKQNRSSRLSEEKSSEFSEVFVFPQQFFVVAISKWSGQCRISLREIVMNDSRWRAYPVPLSNSGSDDFRNYFFGQEGDKNECGFRDDGWFPDPGEQSASVVRRSTYLPELSLFFDWVSGSSLFRLSKQGL